MNVRRISNKASVFLNHKHFHPGNSKNREKVWLAEEKLREEERKQEELLKKRKKEWEIEELRRDLRHSKKKTRSQLETRLETEEAGDRREQLHDVFVDKTRDCKDWIKSGLYEEDVLIGNHSSVWGSFYDVDTKRWGFRCCKATSKSPLCSASSRSKSRISKTLSYSSSAGSSTSSVEAHFLSVGGTFGLKGDQASSLLLNGGKPFSKQQKGVSEFLNLLKKSHSHL